MKHVFNFYVLDSLTETVIGSFTAINSDVAKKILDETIKKNEKLQMAKDSIKLVYYGDIVDMPETYDEIISKSFDCKYIPLEIE